MFFSSDVFTTGIFSDFMNLKDCVGFSDSLVLQQQVKTSKVGVISAMVENEGKIRELCMTIQYDWVSKDTKLNANG